MTTELSPFFTARDRLLQLTAEPDHTRAEFTWPDVGDAFNWAHDVFDVIADDNDTTALWIAERDGGEIKRTFAQLKERSNQVANWMLRTGLKRGDIAMLMLNNRVELWEIMLAALKIGVVILPTSIVLGPHELVDRVTRGRVSAVFAAPNDAVKFTEVPGTYRRIGVGFDEGTQDQRALLWDWVRYEESSAASLASIPKRTASDDAALLYFTSGTTTHPKIVVHSHTSYPLGHLTTLAWIGVRPGDTHCVISAPGWAKHAWSSFFAPWTVGATVFVSQTERFDPDFLVAELDRAGVTTFCAPPTVWRMLIQRELSSKPRALREVVSAGEPLNPEVISCIQEWWGLDIRDGYGQTEMTALIGTMPGEPVVAGAMGRPLPGTRVELRDPITGREADEGEVCLPMQPRPVNLMPGYFEDSEATENATEGGLYRTGDVAQRDEHGVYTFIGRTDDIFKSSDFKVSPFEVESVLLEHHFVAEAAVVGAPDDTRLNITKAYVALAAGVEPKEETAREILAYAREALPPYMRVRRLEFFELPKTTSGKIRRVELRAREVEAHNTETRIPAEWREEDFSSLRS